ncbi:MAG TPA: ABC transporter substrate-binding protein [Jiangellaceae bacterium]|jgi:oligopeptide transport system substrate-binding protein|nr:ABC transporter substrate-binding protein [Jiangellaceae bacterium]
MRVHARKGAVIGAVGFALVLSACGGGGDDDGDGGDAGSGDTGEPTGAVVIGGCQPQNPLVPANTNETCGGDPLDAVFSKLVRYNPDTAAPELEIAESIESEDNITWTVKLKDGWTFHDGTPITAQSFVDAWNWGAYGPNAALNSYFFSLIGIEGAAEVAGEDANGDEVITEDEAPVTEMSGLTVVDDLTFEIKLVAPKSDMPTSLGYTVFAPLPQAFFDDPEAFGTKPIGSGPFSVVEYNENVDLQLTAYPEYAGDTQPQVKDVTFRIYTDQNAEYNDLLADNVDVMTQLPESSLAGEQFKTDLGDRFIERETGVIQTVTFAPDAVDPSMSNIDLRRAISKAIDRDLIVENIFQGNRTPATGWVSPVVDGFKADQCGEWCTYDPEAAKQHLEDAGGFDGTLTLSYNADADHQGWTEATCNSIRNAIGIDCVATPVVDFATFREQITNREMKGIFRTGWQMDYPTIENFLGPIYASAACCGNGSNDGDYQNPDFDAKLAEAAQAPTPEEAITLYQEAEAMLAEDLPSLPMWYGKTIAGYSNNVENVKITPFSTTDLLGISLAESS